MKNSIGEESANSLSSSASKNGAHIASVKAGTSNKWNTTFLPLLISSAREGNSLPGDAIRLELHRSQPKQKLFPHVGEVRGNIRGKASRICIVSSYYVACHSRGDLGHISLLCDVGSTRSN